MSPGAKQLGITLALMALCVGGAAAQGDPPLAFEPVQMIGALEGDPTEIFGEIKDIDVSPDGWFVVLDEMAEQVRVYSVGGQLMQTLGRPGEGPGELSYPASVDVRADGTVTVLDRGNARLTRWVPVEDSLALEGSTRLTIDAVDHCTLGDRNYLVGTFLGRAPSEWNRGMVHEVDGSGAVVRSFGEAKAPGQLPEPFHSSAMRTFNRGPIECAEERGAVYWLSSGFGVVRAFGAQGELRWSRKVPGFLGQEPVMTERGTMTYRPETGSERFEAGSRGAGSWTAGRAVTFFPGGYLLVQLDSLAYPNPADNARTTGVILHPSTGEVLADGIGWPKVGAVDEERVLAWRSSPFPAVVIGRLNCEPSGACLRRLDGR